MKTLCILYDDPKSGIPANYPLDDLPGLEKHPDGMSLPSPKQIDFIPGQLLGCVSRYAAGVREILEYFFKGSPIRDPYLIVQNGQLTGMGAHTNSKSSSTSGS